MEIPLTVLIVEDSESDAQLIARQLKKGGYDVTFERIETAEHMRAALEKQAWNIVISDYRLPQFNGYAALHLLQETGHEIPFIIVSGAIGEENASLLMRSGVHDYVLKDNLTRLAPVVERELAQADMRRQRARAEKSLEEINERYRTLAEFSPMGIFHTDANGATTYVNPAWCRISGMSSAEALGNAWLSAVHPEDRESLRAGWSDTIRLDKTASAEYRFVRPDGSIAWIHGQAVPVKNTEGQTTGYVGTITNMTERKYVEQELQSSRDYLEKVLNTLGDPVFVKDDRHRFVLVNDAGCALFGHAREELIGKTDTDFFPEAQVDVFWEMDNRVLETGEQNTNEELLTDRRTGELRTVITRRTRYMDPAGNRFVVVTMMDITPRKLAEEALRDSHRSTTALLNSLTSHIAVLNQAGRIVSVNDAWMRFAAEEGVSVLATVGIGANYFDVCTKAIANSGDLVAQKAWKGISDVISHASSSFYLEYPCDSPEKTRWFSMRVSPMVGSDAGVVVAHENITERMQAEIRIQHLAQQLRRFSRRLESAREEERTHIAHEIHDELGQALTALRMDLTDIHTHNTQLPDRVRDRLSAMGKVVEQTTLTIQRLAEELRPPMLDELGLVAAVTWYIQEFEERSGIACVRIRIDELPVSDRMRATALYRVLQESLTNVARHSKATQVEMSLTFAGGSVLLEVKDNGRGIADEEMTNLNSIGILGMRERVQGFGGSLEILGVQGSGTTVQATIPWPTS